MRTNIFNSSHSGIPGNFQIHLMLNDIIFKRILIILIFGFTKLYSGSGTLYAQDSSKQSMHQPISKPEIKVTSPKNGDTVGIFATVSGHIKNSNRTYYRVVIIPPNGDNWVQDCKPAPDANGNFSCKGQFGDSMNGKGLDFAIMIMATNTAVNKGVMTTPPPDAIFSDTVTVRRK